MGPVARHLVSYPPASRLLLLLVGLLALPNVARAYVLPADFLCRLVADGRRPSLRDATMTVRLRQGEDLTAAQSPAPDEQEGPSLPAAEARYYFKRPDLLRIEGRGADGREQVEIARGGQRWRGDRQSQQRAGTSDNLMGLLLFPGGDDLDQLSAQVQGGLASSGFDCSATALARWQQGFAYVIGGEPWQTDRPQLWLDKVTFAPIRILWPSASPPQSGPPVPENGGRSAAAAAFGRELRLMNFVAGLPRAWEAFEGGKLMVRAEVVHLLLNQHLDEELFTPREVASVPAGEPPP